MNERYVYIFGLVPFILYFLYHWIKEILFYRKHGWNFDIENPAYKDFMHPDPMDEVTRPYSSAWRIKLGYPLFILIPCILLFASFR